MTIETTSPWTGPSCSVPSHKSQQRVYMSLSHDGWRITKPRVHSDQWIIELKISNFSFLCYWDSKYFVCMRSHRMPWGLFQNKKVHEGWVEATSAPDKCSPTHIPSARKTLEVKVQTQRTRLWWRCQLMMKIVSLSVGATQELLTNATGNNDMTYHGKTTLA